MELMVLAFSRALDLTRNQSYTPVLQLPLEVIHGSIPLLSRWRSFDDLGYPNPKILNPKPLNPKPLDTKPLNPKPLNPETQSRELRVLG